MLYSIKQQTRRSLIVLLGSAVECRLAIRPRLLVVVKNGVETFERGTILARSGPALLHDVVEALGAFHLEPRKRRTAPAMERLEVLSIGIRHRVVLMKQALYRFVIIHI